VPNALQDPDWKDNNRFNILGAEDLGMAHQDATKLRQSPLNLLSNAAKFTSNETITLSAQREAKRESDWLSFSVSDSGIGIAADKRSSSIQPCYFDTQLSH
jgi:signal transduction histidine kinase